MLYVALTLCVVHCSKYRGKLGTLASLSATASDTRDFKPL